MTGESTATKSATDDPMTDAFDALLIIGHGTCDPAGLAEFRFVVEQVALEKTDWHVAGCFLELAEPSIATAVDRLAAAGLSRIRAMPLVLFSAGHAKRDIPDALAQSIARNPGVEIELCPPLGCHRTILELSSERCRAALIGHAAVSPDETLLILVGRGSSDADATAEMRRLADLRQTVKEEASRKFADIKVGFVAAATPSLGTVLTEAALTDFRRVIIQPHLLFAGSVLAEIRQLVEQQERAEKSGKTSTREWIVTEALGPDRRLVTAVVDIVSAVPPRPYGD